MAQSSTRFSALLTNLEVVNRNFQRLSQVINSLAQNVFSLVQITEVKLTTAETTYAIQHGLGRVPIGWFIVDKTEVFTVEPVRLTDNAQADRVLKLSITTSAAQTIKVLLF